MTRKVAVSVQQLNGYRSFADFVTSPKTTRANYGRLFFITRWINFARETRKTIVIKIAVLYHTILLRRADNASFAEVACHSHLTRKSLR